MNSLVKKRIFWSSRAPEHALSAVHCDWQVRFCYKAVSAEWTQVSECHGENPALPLSSASACTSPHLGSLLSRWGRRRSRLTAHLSGCNEILRGEHSSWPRASVPVTCAAAPYSTRRCCPSTACSRLPGPVLPPAASRAPLPSPSIKCVPEPCRCSRPGSGCHYHELLSL